MLTPLFASYLDSNKTNFNESELKPLISRVYLVISSILKSKHEAEDYNVKQIEEEAIEFTALLCMKNGKGIPLILEHIEISSNKIESLNSYEYWLFSIIQIKVEEFVKADNKVTIS